MTQTIPNISGAKVVPDVGTEIHLQAVFVDLQQRRPLRISRSFCELQGRSSYSLCYPGLCLKIQEPARIWLFMLRPWTPTPLPPKGAQFRSPPFLLLPLKLGLLPATPLHLPLILPPSWSNGASRLCCVSFQGEGDKTLHPSTVTFSILH